MDGYRIEKVIFESVPGLHVTALVYVPDAPAGPKPAVLVACGHSPLGKAFVNYQNIAGRLAKRGYVVICWDPVGQGERSQFWDAAQHRSRYNLVCGEHAILGNLATLAGTSLTRWMVWDGMRAVDYLLTRADVDPQAARDHRHERRRIPVALDRRARSAHRRRRAFSVRDGAARAHGEPHLRRSGQRSRTGSVRPRLVRRRSRGPSAARVSARDPRLRRGARTSSPSKARARRCARWRRSTSGWALAIASS